MNDDWTPPLSASLTADSTREEVLAAVADSEDRAARALEHLRTVEFPGLDEANPREGCYWSADGTVSVYYGAIEEPQPLARQRVAGEEDQDDGSWAIG